MTPMIPALLLAATLQSLTLQQCVERALANNLDIAVERINPRIETWGVVSAQSVYDPVLSGGVGYEDTSTPLSPRDATSLRTGSEKDRQLTLQTGLTGKLPTGASFTLTGLDTRDSGTFTSNMFVHTGMAGVSGSQPLLKDFGFSVNSAQIRVARKSYQIAQQNFALKVMDVVRAVNNAYYELVFAIENHKALLEDLDRAKLLLDENRKRVQIGVLSPLDVTQAEAGVAEREEAVIVAEQTIHDSENVLKRLISRDVIEFRGMELLPADYPVVHMVETDVDRSIRSALETRPDFLALKHELEKQGILVKFNRNQLWPQIDLQGSYGLNGRSGSSTRSGTFGEFTDDVGTGNNPAWSVGVAISFPLGNRQARANYHIARLNEDAAVINLKKLEQDIIVQVDNAVRQVQTNLKRVEATAVASRLAQESLNAELEKLRAGTSTSFLVLQAQSQLAAARSAEIRARSDYSESLAQLARVEGTILRQNDVVLDESR